MKDAAKLMNVECSFIGTESVDVQAQAKMVSNAIDRGVDGIALNLIDPLAFDEVVKESIEKGVPIVAFNIDDSNTPNARLSATCQDFIAAGEGLGTRISTQIPDSSTVLLTMHSEGISALEDRRNGIKQGLRDKHINWIEIICGNKKELSANEISKTLTDNPEIKAVLCTGATDTEGAGIALEQGFKQEGVIAAGFDLSQTTLHHIKSGNVEFTIDQQPYTLNCVLNLVGLSPCISDFQPMRIKQFLVLATKSTLDLF